MARPDADPHDETPAVPHEVVREGPSPGVPAGIFQRAFRASFGLAVIVDGEGRIRDLSDAAADLYASRRAALGASLADAPWWDDPDRVRESLRQAHGGLFDRFYTGVTHDGAPRTLLVDVQSVDGPDGEVWLLLEARDVTTLLASEHQLHDAHAQLDRERSQLRAVLDAAPSAIAAVDAEGRVSVVNEAADALGFGELREGESALDDPAWDERWRRALDGKAAWARVYRQLGPDAPFRWFDVAFAPIRLADRVVGAVMVASDVTVRVEADQIQQAVERGAAGAFEIDAAGHVVRASPVFASLLGLPEAATRADVTAPFADPAEVDAALDQALARPGVRLDVHAALEGGRRTVWLRGHSVPTDDGVRLVGVSYDAPADSASRDRWADLVGDAGWGGAEAERVDLDVRAPAPDPARVADRLAALRRMDLAGAEPSETLDALTQLVSRTLGVPISLVSLVDEDRQVFHAQAGLPDPDLRETPLTHSFCQHVANERRPLVVPDARQTARLADNLAIPDLDVVAYLGVPVAAPDGHVIGALCAIDHEPHAWTDDDVRLLSSLAEVVTAEVAAPPPPSPTDD